MSDTTKSGTSADPLGYRREDISVTQTQTATTRRKLFSIGVAAAVTATAPSAVAAVARGDDTELLAMIAKAEALWARQSEVTMRAVAVVREVRRDGDDYWDEALQHPRVLALTREEKALEDAARALDEPIRNYKPRTLEGAVAQAEFIHGDDDFKEVVLTNLRRIMEGRA